MRRWRMIRDSRHRLLDELQCSEGGPNVGSEVGGQTRRPVKRTGKGRRTMRHVATDQ